MKRRQHVAELVKIRQVIQRRVAPHVVKIAQKRCACHRDEHAMITTEGQRIGRVAGLIREGFGDRRDQFAHKVTVKVNHLAFNLGTRSFPVGQGDIIPKLHADVFEDVHGSGVYLFDLVGGHWLS